jgi:phage tail-like protein
MLILMSVPRPFALIRSHDQWSRVAHKNTALLGEVVQLAWKSGRPGADADLTPFTQPGAGLAFDAHCRLFHSIASEGRIERWLWAVMGTRGDSAAPAASVDFLASQSKLNAGVFHPVNLASQSLDSPRGLAVDEADRLFIAEAAARRILIYDIWSQRLLRRVPVPGIPLDVTAHGHDVYAVLASPPGLLRLRARTELEVLNWPAILLAPSRIAVTPEGQILILADAGSAQATIWRYTGTGVILVQQVAFATDLEFQPAALRPEDGCPACGFVMVVARRPGDEFRRFCLVSDRLDELLPLKAQGYDGLGIVRTPDDRIGYWTSTGFRHAVPAQVNYEAAGQVITFQLDGQNFQTNWGRLFLDACIPPQTRITIRCITADELPEDSPIPYAPPANHQGSIHRGVSPPMPPKSLADQLQTAVPRSLHRRETGCELPWIRNLESDRFETYEAPIIAEPGRYLWILVELTGTVRTSPRFRSLRAEYPTHDYLRRLPRTFSRESQVAAFLNRFLALFEGQLGELEAKAAARAILLDPLSAPGEILPWLAGFVGLTLDERMAHAPRPHGPIDVRRHLIQEAVWLFRFRGTMNGMSRFLEIYLGVKPVLVEQFRFRGPGDPALGQTAGVHSNSVLGAGLRVGGAVGESQEQLLAGTADSAFDTTAHRFTVLVPASLSTEQFDVVNNILELHRPAHTLVQVCTVGSGMRVGRGLLIGISSMIGPSGGFTELRAGSFLGRNAIVGRPEAGTRPGPSRLGQDSRVG